MREIKFKGWDKSNKSWLVNPFLDPYEAHLYNSDIELSQFTGLFDKQGKEIYEGDILDHYATSGGVIFEDGMFCLNMSAKVNFGHRQPLCFIDVSQAVIIGNIYENPELLTLTTH